MLAEQGSSISKIRDIHKCIDNIKMYDGISSVKLCKMDPGKGIVSIEVCLPRELFYKTISDESGFNIADDGDLMALLTQLATVKKEYDKVAEAIEEVKTKGYGIVMPSSDELILQEPEIVKRGGKYGVRLKASAPSIHMMMANIETEVSPAVGGERASEDIINFLLQEFEGDTGKIWESNLFGKSMHDIANEGLQAKIKKMPMEAQDKLRNMLQRIVNEGAGGVICIIL